MYAYFDLEKKVIELLDKAGLKDVKIERPPENVSAYFAVPCFRYAKDMKKSPNQIADEISKKIKPSGMISDIKAEGPYINFYTDKKIIAEAVVKDILTKGDKYGSLSEKERVVMDVFQPNTHKEFHIGHVRMAVLGESIRRILVFSGRNVKAASYMGDIGAHIAKWIWYYTNFYKGDLPKKDVARWTGEIYSKASKKAGDNEKYKEEIHEIHRKLEERDPKLTKIWMKTRKMCLDAFKIIQKDLDIHLDDALYESEVEEPGKKIVIKNLEKNIKQIRRSDGAVIADLEEFGLGVFVLLKKNGATLYSTKDIGLADIKNRKFDPYDKSLFIVANEQDHHFRQLFKTLELIGMKNWEKNHHVSYGLVKLADTKMSSRLGNIIAYEDVVLKMKKKAMEIIKVKNPGLKDIEKVSEIIAYGAIKYNLLNYDNVKQVIFDWDRSLDFEGNSGPYLQYSYARSKSIIRKSGVSVKYVSCAESIGEIENKLVIMMSEFPYVVKHSACEYSPHIIANYLYCLAKVYSRFYNDVPILKSDKKTMMFRLSLVLAYSVVMRNGLDLLGIKVPEEM